MLLYINLLLTFIIACVLIIDTIYVVRARKDIDLIKGSLQRDNSLLDMSEFRSLDPTFKGHYKSYVVDQLMPPLMEKANQVIKEEKINEYLKENQEGIERQIKDFTKSL